MKLLVDLSPVANLQHRDGFRDNAPAFMSTELFAASGPGSGAQVENFRFDGIVLGRVHPRQLLLSARKNAEGVTHLRFRSRSILAMASSTGTGVSPDAFASSNSRMAQSSSRSSRIFSYSSTLMRTPILSPFSLVRNCFGSVMSWPFIESTAARWSQQVGMAHATSIA